MADPCPPRIPCPPMPPSPCPQICPPPPPAPPCRVKPVMRGLHWAQTERHIFKAFALAALGGIAFAYLLIDHFREGPFPKTTNSQVAHFPIDHIPITTVSQNGYFSKRPDGWKTTSHNDHSYKARFSN
ncbi:hypothetical protein MSG28_013550 [Choristoneura fumiferana]|uniref:Uncharacterized protein n=1 Tax=Choristoneura fumiferana TaxID=7141 RepID=A0ACC0K829_CHOFU|nr:hypothetical protein MSG28_013550 [Choristoneura fumiferana]